ncbi:MAG: AI-2E family transporter [Alphaproteobacteria bacterium]
MSAEEQASVPERQSVRRQFLFWLGVLVALIIFLSVFSSILLPFVAGMVLAYLLDPLAGWLQRRGLNRLMATLVILLVFVILFVGALLLLIPVLIDQLVGLVDRLPQLIADLQALVQSLLESDLAGYLGIDANELPEQVAGFVGSGANWLSDLLGSVWSGGQALLSILALIVITPVVAFYLLYDWDRITSAIDELLPRQHAGTVREIGRDMSRVISGFVRGQGLVMVILGGFYAIALAAIGLNFGLLIGILAGLLSFVPFVGTATGFVASVGVALAQFVPDGDWVWVLVTACIFVAGQLLENYYLQPKLIGNQVGLHPVWLIFALFAFTLLFGFVGTLVAVPAAAMVAVLLRFAIKQYRASPFYEGRGADTGGGNVS